MKKQMNELDSQTNKTLVCQRAATRLMQATSEQITWVDWLVPSNTAAPNTLTSMSSVYWEQSGYNLWYCSGPSPLIHALELGCRILSAKGTVFSFEPSRSHTFTQLYTNTANFPDCIIVCYWYIIYFNSMQFQWKFSLWIDFVNN